MNKTYHIFALAALGDGLSGGDRIFIEFARRWAKWGRKVKIYVWQEGYNITQLQKLKHKNIEFVVVDMGVWPKFGFFINYLSRIVAGIKLGLTLKIKREDYLYSASDFMMDVFPACILKYRYKSPVWFAGWFQTAPNPLKGYTEGDRERTYKLTSLLYWTSQKVVKPFITKYADFVLVNNKNEKKVFPDKETIVVLGAVPYQEIKNYIKRNKIPDQVRDDGGAVQDDGGTVRDDACVYDAVFQGRLHPQKGVVEMVEIWSEVVNKLPKAKLAVIGDGELMDDVKTKIKQLKLTRNIKLFGYVFDGDKKYKIFSESKLVLHPAFFDSGGMASAEAMAFGIPAIGFNLDSYKDYYPKGMIKVKKGDLDKFAEAIITLLENDKERKNLGNEARKMISKNWAWDTRAKEVLNKIEKK